MSQELFATRENTASNFIADEPLLFKTATLPPSDYRNYFPEFVGQSSVMMSVLENCVKIAATESSVLILGESGTGKEMIAAAIHRLSDRAAKRFVAINCSAIPEDLLESELFGYEKGAFTGADKKRIGYFELAHGGTIFLDEIGEMPKRLQAKLLRVLQEKKFTPLGATEERISSVRIIAATNIDLEQAVKNNEFRLDLFYRLNVFPVYLPTLQERDGDVNLLLDHFLKIANRFHNVSEDCFFDYETKQILKNYSWPGNVRQLQNLVERLVVISGGGEITKEHLPKEILDAVTKNVPRIEGAQALSPSQLIAKSPFDAGVRSPYNGVDLPASGFCLETYIEELENQYILEALRKTQQNKNQAARLLGMNRTTLVERIKKRQIAPINAPSKEL